MTRQVAHRYRLAEQIGTGGSSRVFAAMDERLGRRVAIKLLDTSLAGSADPAGRERFLREGPTSAALLHRNAVAVFDAGEDDGELYIVMEVVDGPSLAQHLASVGPLDVDQSVRIATQVLAALEAAHRAGIVHRDVKPANILLAPSGDAKLTDFGIAKRFDELEESVTRAGTTIGTPRYLSPEQAQGAPLSPATDIYAMGIVLYEMLTGRVPFCGDAIQAVALTQQSRPAPDVRDVAPHVPTAIAVTVARALQRDPADRFATAAEMAAAMRLPPPSVSAEATQVMSESTAVLAAQSGHTEVMPASAIPVVAEAPLPSRRRRRRLPIVLIALAALVVLGIAASRAPDDGADGLVDGTVPTTVPAPTAGPEIIPGFPVTDDLQVFLAQLHANPLLVGTAGPALTDSLEQLLGDESGDEQSESAAELIAQMDEWTNSGQLDPAVADALTTLLTPLIDNVDDDGNGNGNGKGNGKGKGKGD